MTERAEGIAPDPPGPVAPGRAGPPRLNRRSVIKSAGAAALLAVAGCGGTRSGAGEPTTSSPAAGPGSPTTSSSAGTGAPPPSTGATTATTTTAPGQPPSPAAWAKLGSSLTGRLVLPSDPGYLTDVQLFDFRYDDVRPAAVAYCATPDDVARCIDFARTHGITPTPRSGGHSYAGYSTSAGLVVDITRMAAVRPPATPGGTATIGAGARLIDVYSRLNAAGSSIPAGSCPTVGLAGLALGGGIGVVSRWQGLTSDRMQAAQVVTADGRTLSASESANDDLLWACKGGGGGNFGVVTAFSMSTFPTRPLSLFGGRWPWEAVTTLLPAWQHWVVSTPDQLWSTCLIKTDPAGSPLVEVAGVYAGPTSEAQALLDRLIATAGPPSSSSVNGSSFSAAMYVEAGCAGLTEDACHLPTQAPGGRLTREPGVAKSDLLTAPLADAAVKVVVDAIDARQSERVAGAVAYDSLGGATARIPDGATAWVHRNALFSAQYSVPLAEGEPGSAVAADRRWLSDMYAALRPYVSGQAYQNYIDPDLTDWAQAYYGANLPRLEALRRKWDPDGVFDFPQAIPRAGG